MGRKNYRRCVVKRCTNTSTITPDKLFIKVPTAAELRYNWLQLAGRQYHLSGIASLYVCEDHFDLPNDMENYMEYKIMGSIRRIRMTKDCVPSKFCWEKDHNINVHNRESSDIGENVPAIPTSGNKSEEINDRPVIVKQEQEDDLEGPCVIAEDINKSMCRICLCNNARLQTVANTELQDVYEKLTTLPLETEDQRPLTACYVCVALLKRAHSLMVVCLAAEEWFSQVVAGTTPIKPFRPALSVVNYPPFNNISDLNHEEHDINPHIRNQNDLPKTLEDINSTEYDSRKSGEMINVYDNEQFVKIEEKQEYLIAAKSCFVVVKSNIFDSEVIEKREHLQQEDAVGRSVNTISNLFDKDVKVEEKNESFVQEATGGLEIVKVEEVTVVKEELSEDSYEEELLDSESKDSTASQNLSGEQTMQIEVPETSHCQTGIRNDSLFSKHVDFHGLQRQFKCRSCSKEYPTIENLRAHIQNDHIKVATKTCCQCFNKTCRCPTNHLSDKPFRCGDCPRSFIRRRDLKTHSMNKHNAAKPHICDICEKKFDTVSHLRSHKMIHSGDRPYTCDWCTRTFKHRSSFSGHLRRHDMGIRQFVCDLCSRVFMERDNLIKHLRREQCIRRA